MDYKIPIHLSMDTYSISANNKVIDINKTAQAGGTRDTMEKLPQIHLMLIK